MSKDKIHRLLQSGKTNEAEKLCRKYCKSNSNDAETWFILGTILAGNGRITDAIEALQKSIHIRGNVDASHYNLGLLYMQSGEFKMARASFERALEISPAAQHTRLELANAIQAGGSPGDAISVYEQILAKTPGMPNVLSNLATACVSAGDHRKAIDAYTELLRIQGESAELLFNLGNACRDAGEAADAEIAYRQALKLKPDACGIYNNLGLVLFEQRQFEAAAEMFEQSIDIESRQTDAYINLSKCQQELHRLEHARETLERALARHPDKPEIHWEYALVLLKLGNLEQGWPEYEWRKTGYDHPPRTLDLQVWSGEDISERSLLVLAEQGIGDEIMFASCFPDLYSHAGKVTIDCEPRLASLFERSFPEYVIRPSMQTDCIDQFKSPDDVDLYVTAGSLPQFLRGSPADFPMHEGYLRADPGAVDKWKTRYDELGKALRIGISWRGGHEATRARRSTDIQDWLPILQVEGVCLVNLQYGDTESDRQAAIEISGTPIHHWDDSDPLRDMDDFAAQVTALDLVISIDNATVHLAGALGVNTWVLQAVSPDWRWGEAAESSRWYPSVRQFHKTSHGNWHEAFLVVRKHLLDAMQAAAD